MKIKPFTTIIIIFSFISIGNIYSQEEKPGAPNEQDKQYVPDKNSIFDSKNKSNDSRATSGSNTDFKNIVKFNPTLLSRSIAAFSYNRRLSSQITLEGGLGVCFNKDRVLGLVADATSDFSSSSTGTHLSLTDLMQKSITSGSSIFGEFSFRLNWDSYFNWDVFPYFEVNTRFYSNKLTLQNDGTSNTVINGSGDVTVRNTAINFLYGTELVTDGKIRTTHDFYFGVGLRSTSYDQVTISNVYGINGNQYDEYTRTTARLKTMAPTFIMGYVFGIGF